MHKPSPRKQTTLCNGRRKFLLLSSPSPPRTPQNKNSHKTPQGYPEDLIVSIALGADMFDCVWPTRTAVTTSLSLPSPHIFPSQLPRSLQSPQSTTKTHKPAQLTKKKNPSQRFGNAITPTGLLNLRLTKFSKDYTPICESCTCPVCLPSPTTTTTTKTGLGITRALLHHLAAKETAGAHLLTMHNVHYQLTLMREAREAIVEDRFVGFVKGFFGALYDGDGARVPRWAVDALRGVGVDLLA